MTEAILKILGISGKIFSDERRRYHSKRRLELQTNVDTERAKLFPEYKDASVAKAEKALNNYLDAYAEEFETSLTQLLARVGSNV